MNTKFTSTAIEYLLSESPVHTILSFTDGTVVYQCTDATQQGSVTIDYACSGGEGLELGACVATQLSFSLYTSDLGFGSDFNFKDFNTVTLELGIGDETILVGTYKIDGSPRMKSLVSITAFDFMTEFDKEVDMVEWQTWVGGHTIAEAVAWCCNKCGITSSTMTGLANASHLIKTFPQEPTTYRQIISWAFMAMGVIGYMDADNHLCCRYPERNLPYTKAIAGVAIAGNTVVGRDDIEQLLAIADIAVVDISIADDGTIQNVIKTYEATDRFSSDWDETVKVTGLKYNNADGTYQLTGTDDYTFDLSGNPFVDDPSHMLGQIFAQINGRESTVMSMDTVTTPWITPLDWIGYVVDGETHYGIVTNATHTINGHSLIACTGEIQQTIITAMSGAAATAVRQSEQRVTDKILLQAHEIELLGDEVSLKVGADGVITAINASSEGISIDANRININGVVSANGGFLIDKNGNMTANNGTFNGVVNATSGTIDNITATNLTISSGDLTAKLIPTGMHISSASATAYSRYSNGSLSFTRGDQYTIPNVVLGLDTDGSGYLHLGLIGNNIRIQESDDTIKLSNGGEGYVEICGGNDSFDSYITIHSGFYSSVYGFRSITITPSCNVAALQYTVVSTF